MRGRSLIEMGAIAIGIGLTLTFFPVTSQLPTRVFSSSDRVLYPDNVTVPAETSSLGSHIQYKATWTSSTRNGQPTNGVIHVYDCGFHSNCSGFNPNTPPLVVGSGSSGSVTWQGEQGESFMVVPALISPDSNLTVAVSYSEPFLGGVFGVVISLIGIGGVLFGLYATRRGSFRAV